jgi:amidase
MQTTFPRHTFSGIIEKLSVESISKGPLSGLTFAAKDNIDIAGYKTGAGNPDWQNTHEPAKVHAVAVQLLLNGGAHLVAKTCTDEFAFSLDGINIHYGVPSNPQDESRIPGGSSSGSASVVGNRLFDFAIGTDTGGSVRVPAAYCGIYGMRPTHGRISTRGVVPLAPSMDTVGWFARDPFMLKQVGEVLLNEENTHALPNRILLASDALALASDEISEPMLEFTQRLEGAFGEIKKVNVAHSDLETARTNYVHRQGRQCWGCHGEWVTAHKPNVSAKIKNRLDIASKITEEQFEKTEVYCEELQAYLNEVLSGDGGSGAAVIILPTTLTLPLPVQASDEELESMRAMLQITAIASLSGFPQITIPVQTKSHWRVGVSFLGPRNSDAMLLALAEALHAF